MPTPKPEDETREEFLDRCIPAVLDDGAAEDEDQAVAMCSTMWEQHGKGVAKSRLRRRAADEGIAATPKPKPKPDETRQDFLDRCIPAVLDGGAAKDEDQAAKMCSTMWGEAKGAHRLVRRAAEESEPKEGSREEFMERCVSQALDDGKAEDEEQAVTMCSAMWDKQGKAIAEPNVVRRAYGLFGEVKSLDEDKRIVEGIATTPSPDRMGDIVDPLGAKYVLPIPLLYQHSSNAPVGEVFEARPTKDGIKVKARVFKAQHSRLLKERLDEAWESLKIGLLKGFSIGFAPLSVPEIIEKTAGYYYKSWEWLELSIVTIPANQEASIALVKTLYRESIERNGGRRVVRLDPVTLAKAKREIHPGVVYLK